MFKLFDSHCHLQMEQFDADREAALSRMREKEMGAIVIGTDYEVSKAGLALAKSHDFLWAAVGLHPNDNPKEKINIAEYEALAADPKVVAIGECGLDYFRIGGTNEERAGQKERFIAQIELAKKLDKTLVVHCRNAHEDCLEILKSYEIGEHALRVVIHFFTGSGELAQQYLSLGCWLSFPGPITYTDMYDESMRATPLERMLIETDSPFAAPVPHRGKRNEPAYVEHVAAKIAEVKSVSVEKVKEQTVLNAGKAFKLTF